MKRRKTSSPVAGEKLFRSKDFRQGYGDPYESINGKSNNDGYDRSELNVSDRKASQIDQDFSGDYDGDEDFYGDDEENQSGHSSYSGDQQRYLGQGDWADRVYGENKYSHQGDVDYAQKDRRTPQVRNGRRSSDR
jgi:hypothetical protein